MIKIFLILILISINAEASLIRPHDFKPFEYSFCIISSAEVSLYSDLIQNKKPVKRDRTEAIREFTALINSDFHTEDDFNRLKKILYSLLLDRDYDTYYFLYRVACKKDIAMTLENPYVYSMILDFSSKQGFMGLFTRHLKNLPFVFKVGPFLKEISAGSYEYYGNDRNSSDTSSVSSIVSDPPEKWDSRLQKTYWIKSDTSLLKSLLEAGINPNGPNIPGCDETPLSMAIRVHNEMAAKLLIESGADVNFRCFGGYSALHLMANFFNLYYDTEILKCLLEHGADVNARDDNGRTPLFYCRGGKFSGVLDYVKTLVESGADVSAVDDENKSILYVLNDGGAWFLPAKFPEVTRYLISKGAHYAPVFDWSWLHHEDWRFSGTGYRSKIKPFSSFINRSRFYVTTMFNLQMAGFMLLMLLLSFWRLFGTLGCSQKDQEKESLGLKLPLFYSMGHGITFSIITTLVLQLYFIFPNFNFSSAELFMNCTIFFLIYMFAVGGLIMLLGHFSRRMPEEACSNNWNKLAVSGSAIMALSGWSIALLRIYFA
ncbi:MAG: ankyrin repeat domain-containing protein [Candidatus Wallbacteria bacterium]|nr:ankyrin repeat domain-containing protein [Candidatus Wallbacteria bacterium]